MKSVFDKPRCLRNAIRAGLFRRPTAGQAPGYVQTNLVVLPKELADEFAGFCQANSQPCPLVEMTSPGDPEPKRTAPRADLRTDVPKYRLFRDGQPEAAELTDLKELWRDDFVGFLLGCSFTFETALVQAGISLRHIEQGRNVSMYRTNRECETVGRFAGPLVVSMRPLRTEQVEQAREITGHFPEMHGAPIHAGDPAALGIHDLTKPDFGDAVDIYPGETPVFWACGVTPQLALAAARPELAMTHSPGHMFVTDLTDAQFYQP